MYNVGCFILGLLTLNFNVSSLIRLIELILPPKMIFHFSGSIIKIELWK